VHDEIPAGFALVLVGLGLAAWLGFRDVTSPAFGCPECKSSATTPSKRRRADVAV